MTATVDSLAEPSTVQESFLLDVNQGYPMRFKFDSQISNHDPIIA